MYIFNMWEIVTAISVLIIAIFWVITSVGLLMLFKSAKKSLETLNQRLGELIDRLTPIAENLEKSSEKVKEIVDHVDDVVESVDEVIQPLKENKETAFKGLFIGLASSIGVRAIKNFVSKKFSNKKEV